MRIHFNALTLQALIGELLTYFHHLFGSCIVFPDLLESTFHPLVLRTFFHFFFQHKINVFAHICLPHDIYLPLRNHFPRVLSKIAHQEVAQMV
jgi:hypothetical protein